ncbi:MAG: hypothetical protein WEE89_09170 [Gemmatimonadota bacterium]
MSNVVSRGRGFQRLLLSGAVLIGLLILNVVFARPDYNWDMLAYVAIAHELSGDAGATAHQRTYEQLRTRVSAADYQRLTESNSYRALVARDAQAFSQQLPGYRVKIVYPWLIAQLETRGFDPFDASELIAKLAYVALGLVVMAWLGTFLPALPAVMAAWLVMSLTFMLDLARLSTPDALSTLVVMTGLFLTFHARRYAAALALLIAGIAVRPDNVVWLAAVGAILVWRVRANRLVTGTAVASGVALVWLLGRWAGSPSWATLFHHAFVGFVPYQLDVPPTLQLPDYLRVYLRESHPANLPPFLLLFALVGGLVFWVRLRLLGKQDSWVELLGTSALFGLGHWLIYPNDDRFFAAAYLTIMIAFVNTAWLLTRPRPTPVATV